MGRRSILPAALLFSALLFVPGRSHTTPAYSERTGRGCKACHMEADGGALTKTGLEYAASGYVWPPEGGYRVMGPIRKSVRLVVGLLHVVAGFLWFGTILYVHILLRPGYAARGLPRGEVFLGLVSMTVVGITGALLTISRIRSLDVLHQSTWGVLLSTKIALYLIMVSSALLAVFFVGPRLGRGARTCTLPRGGVFDPLTLSAFDGRDGRPAYVAYKGKVLDVTGLRLWENGIHMKHAAGSDLTGALSKAAHGEEKLELLKGVGSFDPARKPEKTGAQKAFYFVAYMNLIIVFLVLCVIAFWKWGIWMFPRLTLF